MNFPTLNDFPRFFENIHNREPYDWQCRLVKQVIDGKWPGAIDLPTGSGKTSCLDIAIFALACSAALPKNQRTLPRRIFFCVNRRVIVDEAYQRAVHIARKIAEAEGTSSVLGMVANALRKLSTLGPDSAPPLDVLELRGGIYRDSRWARSATQPTIICTTIDQLGSRLLFRGYGVSSNAAPIQAGLIAYDSLVFLDEAHISRPFLQTLQSIERYLDPVNWAEKSIGVKPMVVVPMTATPPEGINDQAVIRLENKDRTNNGLNNRLITSKKAILRSVSDLPDAAIKEAKSLVNGTSTAVGIIVNRVDTARKIYEGLWEIYKDQPEVIIELVIGSMRPIDRERQSERLRKLVGPDRPSNTTQTSFVVATQCLEVGADYDFDVLVSECASLDALRQRFGRLNRGGRLIDSRAIILIDEKNIKQENQLDEAKPLDPIYGNALARTWNWLMSNGETVTIEAIPAESRKRPKKNTSAVELRRIDFGIDAFSIILQQHGDQGRIPANLLAPSASKDAPVMLPAYVDFWCQTSPRPTPDPEVSLFIHGPDTSEPDVQVCWRTDLIDDNHINQSAWCDVLGLLPPTSAECMSVPISRVRKWLSQGDDSKDDSDLLGIPTAKDDEDDSKKGKQKPRSVDPSRVGVLWRGPNESCLIKSPRDLQPGDTLVLPVSAGGWDRLGHVPETSLNRIDVAEIAFQSAKDRAALRLHPALRNRLPETAVITEFFTRIANPEDMFTPKDLRLLLDQIAAEIEKDDLELSKTFRYLASPQFGLLSENYPDRRGLVMITRQRLDTKRSWYFPAADDGNDDRSRTMREQPIRLGDHTKHVLEEVSRSIHVLPLDDMKEDFFKAAEWHDLGKADERFQAMLRREDRTDAWLRIGMDNSFLAKSDGFPQTPDQRKQSRDRAGLPEGFRHEMLSVQIIENNILNLHQNRKQQLALHLIASHHGYARPFAPVVNDEENPEVRIREFTITTEQRKILPPHRIDSGIPERFWELTRCYGWWGLAYLEAVLRLADQQASTDEDEKRFDIDPDSAEFVGATS